MKLSGWQVWLWAIVLAGVVSGPLLAQEEAAQEEATQEEAAAEGDTDAAPEEAEEYVGIPITDVAVVGRDTELALRELRRELTGGGEVDRLRPLFDTELEANSGLVEVLDPERIAKLDRRRLADLRKLLMASIAQMHGWQETLTVRARRFRERYDEISISKARWAATAEAASGVEEIPETITGRIRSVLDGLEEVEAALNIRLTALLALQDDIAEAELFVDDALEQVSAAEGAFRQSLFVRDSPPLIEALMMPSASLIAQMREEVERRILSFRDYVLRNLERWLWQGAAFLALLGLMYLLRARSREWEAEGYDAPLETTNFLVTRPISAALVLTLILSIWIHPNMPLAVSQVLMLVAIFPLGRLLYGVAAPEVWPGLFALVVLFVVHMGSEILPESSASHRTVLLGETVVVFAALIWLLRKRGARYREASGFLGAMAYVVPTAILMIGGSIVANLVGRGHLSSILVDAVLVGAALAVLVWICSLIAGGVARLAFRRRRRQLFNVVRNHSQVLERSTVFAINGLAVYVWLRAFLGLLELYQPLLDWLGSTLDHKWIFGKLTLSFRTVLTFTLILIGAALLARLIRIVLDEEIFARLKLPRGFPGLISLLIRYPILVLGFILAVSAAGVDLSSFGLMAGALGVGIGFGMQNIIANFVSGIILTFERPIQVGDTIAVGPLLGNVTDIGVRSSKVKTFDGAEVIVPNSDLISKEVINWTLSDRRRKMKVQIKVGFASNPHEVVEILLRTATEHPATLEDPPGKVLFQGYSESGLDFQLQFWVQFEKGLVARSEVLLKIYDALGKAGIKPPIPRREVTMKNRDEMSESDPESELPAAEVD